MTLDAFDSIVCGDNPLYQFAALVASVPEAERHQVLRDLRLIAATKVALEPPIRCTATEL